MAVHVDRVVHYHLYTSLCPLYAEQDGPLNKAVVAARPWALGEECWIGSARRWRNPVHRTPGASGLLLLCSMPSLVTNHSPPSATGKLVEGSVVLATFDDKPVAALGARQTSENSPSETVWKSGIGPEWGSESGQEEWKESPFGCILSPQRRAPDALGYFPNSFSETVRKGCVRY